MDDTNYIRNTIKSLFSDEEWDTLKENVRTEIFNDVADFPLSIDADENRTDIEKYDGYDK